MYTVYALQFCNSGRIYVGFTNDLNRRLAEHKRGHTKSTKNRGDYLLVYTEECSDRVTARTREKYWKSGFGKEQLKKMSS